MTTANGMDKALELLQQRDFAEAENLARSILKRERRNAQAIEVLAEALLGLGRPETVLVELQKRQPDKSSPVFLTLLGRANLDLGRGADAERFFREAVAVVPSYAPAFVALSEALAITGRLSEGVAVLERGAALLPRHPGLSFALARLQAESGALMASRAICERLCRGVPRWSGAALLLARVLESLGEIEAARGVLRDFLGRQPFNPIARISLARLSLQEGDLDGAKRRLRDVTRSSPELTGQAVLTLAESPNGHLHLRVSNAIAGLTG
jgi:tetratricopeptide (TPR) repeat protein